MRRKKFEDTLEAVNFIGANMLAHSEFDEQMEIVSNRLAALENRITSLENKITGTNRRLDGEAMERQDFKLPERVSAIEKHLGINS